MIPNACPMCMKEGESIDHLFMHCKYAREVWAYIFMEVGLSWVMPRVFTNLVWSRIVIKIS